MKPRLLTIAPLLALAATAAAQSTAFTYQGRLKNGAALATGLHDFRFTLFNAASGGVVLGSPQCVDNLAVTEGLFTTTLDFSQQYATTNPLFLQIEVRADTGLTCANTTGLVLLAPRQTLTATPMASHAKSAFALDAADGSPVSAVFVDNDGRVGIGTTAPGGRLDIQGSNNSNILFGRSNGGALAHNLFIDGLGNGSMQFLDSTSTPRINLGSGDTTYFNYGNVGIGTITPLAKLDVRGTVKLGATGQLFAPGGEENLRILRGVVLADASIFAGTGFTVTPIATGRYRINFAPSFTGPPAVMVNWQFNSGASLAAWGNLNSASVEIRLENGSGFANGDFSFIAMGPR